MIIKILLLIVFFAVMLYIGYYSRHQAKTVEGYVLGGRNVGPWISAFAYGTSYFSAVVFVGYAGQFGWRYGLASTWIGIGNAVIGSLLAWIILGRRTRVMTKHMNSATMPAYFESRYDSKTLKIVASAIIFIFLIPYTASVYNGLSNLFEMAFGIPYIYCVCMMAVLTCVYVLMGGYTATVYNDFVQGIIMLLGIVIVILSVLNGHGGFMNAVRQLSEIPSDNPITMGQQGAFASFFGPDPVGLLYVIILTSLGTWGLPQMVQKFYAIKSEKAVATGTIVSTFFAVVIAGGSYFLGGFARLIDVSLVSKTNPDGTLAMMYDHVMPQLLSNLPDILMGVLIVLIMSASMSTLSSLVLTSSSTMTLDFLKGTVMKKMTEKQQLWWLRAFVIFFIVISVAIAMNPPTFIAQLMGISWGALAGAFLAPFMYGLYWKGVTKAAVWASFIYGVGLTVANMYTAWMSPIQAGAIAMLGGLVLVPIVSMLTPKMDKAMVDGIFACYDVEVDTTTKNRLPDEEDVD